MVGTLVYLVLWSIGLLVFWGLGGGAGAINVFQRAMVERTLPLFLGPLLCILRARLIQHFFGNLYFSGMSFRISLTCVATLLLLFSTCAPQSGSTEYTEAERPNVLLFIADDWSFPHAGAYGDRVVRTPTFDALAAGGMLFTNAYCPSPSCSPSRASVLTGRYPFQNGVAGNLWSEFPAELTTYTDQLGNAGYFVGHDQKGWAPGDWQATGRPHNPAGPRFDNFKNFLDAKKNGQPFCFWFGSKDPHREYQRNLGAETGMHPDSVHVPPYWPDLPCVRNDILDYYAEVERFDRHVGQVVDLLRERDELDNTLIIVTSDNGMPFPRAKATLYDAGTRMPFVVHWPARVPAGTRHEGFVSTASVAPTFLAAAGMDVPAAMTLPSLLGEITGGDKAATEVVIARERHAQVRADSGSYAVRGLRNDSFLYLRNYYPERWPAGDPEAVLSVGAYGDVDNSITKMLILAGHRGNTPDRDHFALAFGKRPAEELYQLRTDPDQLNNLAADPNYASALKKHADRLRGILLEAGDPRARDPLTSFWDDARYTPTYGKRTYDLAAYLAEYRYAVREQPDRFSSAPCLPD
jgi:arylsulfatase A-like enzyme